MLRIKINIIELILIDNRVINMIDMINMIEIKRMIKKWSMIKHKLQLFRIISMININKKIYK